MSADYDPKDLTNLQEKLDAILEDLGTFGKFHDKWIKIRNDQRRRGLNDFNVFTILREAHKEVGLHSRFISYLLNPSAGHEQGDLFLGLFLKECGYPNFLKTETESVQVIREHSYIDIYITDGYKHVIIENKIHAGDQPGQIKRYIDTVMSNGASVEQNNEDILVIYLSLYRENPTEESLGRENPAEESPGEWKIGKIGENQNYHLMREKQCCLYKSLRYKSADGNGVWNWLFKCHEQVRNITNLSVAITQYREVIDILYGDYEGKTMSFVDYLDEHREALKLWVEIEKLLNQINVENIRTNLNLKLVDKFWEDVEKGLREKIENKETSWCLKWSGNGRDDLISARHYATPLWIVPKDISENFDKSPCYFSFSYNAPQYRDILMGVVWNSQHPKKESFLDAVPHEKDSPLRSREEKTDFWPKFIRMYDKKPLTTILNESLIRALNDQKQGQKFMYEHEINRVAENFVDDFIMFFNHYKDAVDIYIRNNLPLN